MIAPALTGGEALAARLTALPQNISGSLAQQLDRLGESLRDRLDGDAASIAFGIDTAPETVTATLTIATRPAPARQSLRRIRLKWAAGVRPAPSLTLPRLRGREGWGPRRHPPRRASLRSVFLAMLPEIRAGLAAALRRGLVR